MEGIRETLSGNREYFAGIREFTDGFVAKPTFGRTSIGKLNDGISADLTRTRSLETELSGDDRHRGRAGAASRHTASCPTRHRQRRRGVVQRRTAFSVLGPGRGGACPEAQLAFQRI